MSRRCAAGLAAIGIAALAGCGIDTDTPVAQEAQAPFVCGRVPVTGIELMSGRDDLVGLGDPEGGAEIPSYCVVKDGEDIVFTLQVEDVPATRSQAPLEFMAANGRDAPGARDLTSEDTGTAGEGYVAVEAGAAGLSWACDDTTMVGLYLNQPPQGRDTETDLVRYATSVLQTACAAGSG